MNEPNNGRTTSSLLYVEDHSATRETVSAILRQKFPSLQILTAENGEAGLELFKAHRPDVVVTDINMPVLDGIQMSRAIREVNPEAKIIAATALNDTHYLLDAIGIGINQYVLKPFNFTLLFEAIEDCLTKVSMKRQIESQQALIGKLSSAVEQSASMIMLSNARGGIEYVNPRYARFTGYAPEEVVGQNLRIILGNTSPLDTVEMIWSVITRGTRWCGELMNRKKDGELYCENLSISPLVGAAGEITHFVAVMEDISELHQARQDHLKVQNLESLGLLAGGIAHDFNNILTGLLGNVGLARLELPDPQATARHLDMVEKSAARATELTQRLLTFARGGEPIKKTLEIRELLEQAADHLLHGSSVDCELLLAADLWPVDADQEQLSQVFHNVVLNAIQSMPEGGTVTIRAQNVTALPQGKHFVTISVSDTGCGIPQSHMPMLFDPYFTTRQHGCGLGLATSYSIVRKHGGKIRAKSVLGQGSSFTISLPASLQEKDAGHFQLAAGSRESVHILLMDDEEEIRTVTGAILERSGYTVDCAASGTEAVELFRQRKEEGSTFSAVILDLTVPGGVGGREAMKILQEIDPDVRAIVSSGYSSDPVMANYRDYGFRALLKKPYGIRELCEALEEVLGS